MADYFYLLILFDQQQWRRPLALKALLKGRRTVSNLYAGLDYGLLSLYQLLPHLPAEKFEQALRQLVEAGLIAQQGRQARLTVAGQKAKVAANKQLFLPQHYAGLKFQNSREFIARLFLVTQASSELKKHNRHYFPLAVAWSTQQAVKNWLRQQNAQTLVSQLHQEWYLLFATLPQWQADYYSQFLLGHQVQPASTQQADHWFAWSSLTGELVRQDTVHWFLQQVTAAPKQFPLLTSLWQPLATGPLGTSAAQTMTLCQQGLSLTEISRQRRIKQNTLKEHLLEAAILLPDFPFDHYLTAPTRRQLTTIFADQPLATWQFSQLAATDLSFFDYRLFQIQKRKAHD